MAFIDEEAHDLDVESHYVEDVENGEMSPAEGGFMAGFEGDFEVEEIEV